MLFWKVVERGGGGALLEEVNHWRWIFRFGHMAPFLAQSQLPGYGQNVTSHLTLYHCAFPTGMDSIYP